MYVGHQGRLNVTVGLIIIDRYNSMNPKTQSIYRSDCRVQQI